MYPEALQDELANEQHLMPGPASAELTTENSIKQLQPYTVSAFTYSLNSDNLATQQLDGMVKGEGGT